MILCNLIFVSHMTYGGFFALIEVIRLLILVVIFLLRVGLNHTGDDNISYYLDGLFNILLNILEQDRPNHTASNRGY